jgi:hypothetical protein
VVLTEEQGATLRGWLGAGKTEQRMAFRAEVILAIAEGLSNQAVAERLGTRPATVSKWRAAWRGRVSRVCATRCAAASPGSTRATMSGASWRLWMSRRRRGTGAGTAACWPGIWATSPNIRSGGFCAGMRSRWRGTDGNLYTLDPFGNKFIIASNGAGIPVGNTGGQYWLDLTMASTVLDGPTEVPEPNSIALLFIAALGVISVHAW